MRLVGFDGADPYEAWIAQRFMMILGLSVQGVDVHWGGPLPSTGPAVWIARRDRMEPSDVVAMLRQGAGAPSGSSIDASRVVSIHADLFAAIGSLLSRHEEFGGAADPHGRFRRADSAAARASINSPIVDEMVGQIRDAIVEVAGAAGVPVTHVSPWPENKRSAICLTHDIDYASRRSFGVAGRKAIGAGAALAAGNTRRARRRAVESVGFLRGGSHSPHWMIDGFAEIEEQAGVRSAFYVMPNQQVRVMEGGRPTRRYLPDHPEVRALLQRLADGGWELGLHTSYDAHESRSGISRDVQILRSALPFLSSTLGARSHFLRFDVERTWSEEASAGIAYDSSLGWSEGWGFRSGSMWPYRVFDRAAGSALPIWEFDLHLMDSAIAAESEFKDGVASVVSRAKQHGGAATLLFHPSPPGDLSVRETLDLYRGVVERVAADPELWVARPIDVMARLEQHEAAIDEELVVALK